MRKSTQKLIALAAMVTAILVPAAVFAAMHHGDMHHGDMAGAGGFELHHLMKQLNLTDEQKQSVKDIVASHKADIASQMTKLHEARAQLFSA
ncbi:MAG: Spy/CpxP family protein refolding chaperone, partial [Acidobacteriota bacterium]|nr:Spy/CpxP family protein refolding chaperone [Acidobacteriota bacterium]